MEQFLTNEDAEKLWEGKYRAERVRMEKEKVEEVLEKLQSLH